MAQQLKRLSKDGETVFEEIVGMFSVFSMRLYLSALLTLLNKDLLHLQDYKDLK